MKRLADLGIGPGRVVGIRADFSADAVACLLALVSAGAVAALIPPGAPDTDTFLAAAKAHGLFSQEGDGSLTYGDRGPGGEHPLLKKLGADGHGGVVIFSSGSTGRPKAVLHDFARFTRKFETPGRALVTLGFLLFDHVAGLDTLCYTLAHGGTLVLPEGRDPQTVCRLIAAHRVQVLPVSPTFLNLLLLSGADREADLSAVEVITYGSEPMPDGLLKRLQERFSGTRLVQKYGTTEFGAPPAKSRGDGPWLRFGPEVGTRVVDGILWVKAPGAMLGYLDRDTDMEDGWYCTGDQVEMDGDWMHVLGRKEEMINVGGEKVNPAEVEAVLLELPGVAAARVTGEAHPITGQIVVATLQAAPGTGAEDLGLKVVRRHCRERLAPYKVPMKVAFGELISARHKTVRR